MTEGRKSRLMQGNQACAEAALAAGIRFFAGYPITPSTEIAEILADRLPRVGGKFIQMEDEIGSMAAVIGASLAGKKSMTATSGPGFSLKQENIGFAAMAEVPCVIINVMRSGPSTGMPTSPAQGDVMQARWGTHGDHPVIVLAPSSVIDAYRLTVKAVNLSEELRVPVIILMDEIIGHMREKVSMQDMNVDIVNRPRPNVPPEKYKPYEAGPSGVPPMASFGEGYRFHVTGLAHDETGFPSNDGTVVQKLIERLHRKIEENRDKIVITEEHYLDDAEVAVVAYGSVARSSEEAVEGARQRGMRAGLLRLATLWPFPVEEVAALAEKVKSIIVPEMNMGQMIGEVERAAGRKVPVYGLNRADGVLFKPEEIIDAVRKSIYPN